MAKQVDKTSRFGSENRRRRAQETIESFSLHRDAKGKNGSNGNQSGKLSPGGLPDVPTPYREQYNVDALLVHPDQVFANPKNARTIFDEQEISELATSIKRDGIIQPINVRPKKFQRGDAPQYEAIAGDRRLMAAKRAGLTQIPVIVKNVNDATARRINLIENIQRQDLNEADMGQALQDLKNEMQAELDRALAKVQSDPKKKLTPLQLEQAKAKWLAADKEPAFDLEPIILRAKTTGRRPKITWEDVGREVDLVERHILHLVKIAGLDPDVQDEVRAGAISGRQARAVTLLDDPKLQRKLAREIKQKGLSGDEASERARELISQSRKDDDGPEPGHYPAARLRRLVGKIEKDDTIQVLAAVRETLKEAEVGENYSQVVLREINRIRTIRAKEERQMKAIEEVLSG